MTTNTLYAAECPACGDTAKIYVRSADGLDLVCLAHKPTRCPHCAGHDSHALTEKAIAECHARLEAELDKAEAAANRNLP